MQCGDTDLILCLSTCTDILMRSAPLLWSTQEVFNTLCSKRDKKKTPSYMTEITSLPKSPKNINTNTETTYC